MTKDVIVQYQEYVQKIGNRKPIYKTVAKEYKVQSEIYPDSHIDILPSLVIPKVIYVDNFKGTMSFFKQMDVIKKFIASHKEYEEVPCIEFLGQDYTKSIEIEPVDLIISQYAGFVGQATKQVLKVGGILLCNDSHGDATLANFDKDFQLVGVLESNGTIRTHNLDVYFTSIKGKGIDLDFVRTKMKGLKYQNMAENYLFEKVT